MKISAILWDGQKKINGNLFITELSVDYSLTDFADTNLEFSLKYEDIKDVEYYELYETKVTGIQITSKSGKKNVFITKDLDRVRNQIINRIKTQRL